MVRYSDRASEDGVKLGRPKLVSGKLISLLFLSVTTTVIIVTVYIIYSTGYPRKLELYGRICTDDNNNGRESPFYRGLQLGNRLSSSDAKKPTISRMQLNYEEINKFEEHPAGAELFDFLLKPCVLRRWKIVLINIEEQEVRKWDSFAAGMGKVIVLPVEPVPKDMTWADLFPEWIDEEDVTTIPKCPKLPLPSAKNGFHLDGVVVRVPCKEKYIGSRDLTRLQMLLAGATASTWTSDHTIDVLIMSECQPILNLFSCRELRKQKGNLWLYSVNTQRMRHRLALPVGSCELAIPIRKAGIMHAYMNLRPDLRACENQLRCPFVLETIPVSLYLANLNQNSPKKYGTLQIDELKSFCTVIGIYYEILIRLVHYMSLVHGCKADAGARLKSISQRQAYATIIHSGGEYVCGAIVGAQSIRLSGSDRDLVALVDDSLLTEERSGLESAGWKLHEIQRVENTKAPPSSYNRWNYSKFRLWQLHEYDKIIFIDSDLLVLRNLDFLFEMPELSATGNDKSLFNSGVMLIEPSNCTFNIMMDKVGEINSYNFGDQGYLNEIFPWWHRIPKRMNYLKHFWSNEAEEFEIKAALFGSDPPALYAIHYLGFKPWLCFRDYDCNFNKKHNAIYASDIAHARWWKVHDSMPRPLQAHCYLTTKQKAFLEVIRREAEAANFEDGHYRLNISDSRLTTCVESSCDWNEMVRHWGVPSKPHHH